MLFRAALLAAALAARAPTAAGAAAPAAAPPPPHGAAPPPDGLDAAAPDHVAQHAPSSPAVRALLAAYAARQAPPKSACRSTRLLVTHLDDEHFEGLGSVLGEVLGALGEAAHSNRTLVWGLGLPYMLDRTRDEWAAPLGSRGAGRVWWPRGEPLDCSSWEGSGGGAWACFFRALSTCSLEDASVDELVALGADPYNNSARLKLMEHRRGVAAFTVPAAAAAPDFAAAAAGARSPRHAMAAATAGYLFRLAPRVAAAVEARRADLWGGRAGVACPRGAPPAPANRSGPVWAMHVRRGDVARNAAVYGNRRLFSFDAMLAEAARAAHAAVAAGRPAPAAIYVASDGAAAEWVEDVCARRAAAGAAFPGGVLPAVFAAAAGERFTSPLGSHTAAADGGCQAECALEATDVLALRTAAAKPGAEPSAVRMMRVLAEAAEELFLLSRADEFIGQASSFFSTSAMLLGWAHRAGGADAAATHMPDAAGVAAGTVQCGLIAAGLNATAAIPAGRGHERWIAVSKRFIGGVTPEDTAECGGHTTGYLFGCDIPARRMRFDALLPLMPAGVFAREARRWLGAPAHARVWDGECPLLDEDWEAADGADVHDALRFAALSFDAAEGHRASAHQGQAFACWDQGERALRAAQRAGLWVDADGTVLRQSLANIVRTRGAYHATNIRKYATRDGVVRGIAHALRPRALLPPLGPAPPPAGGGEWPPLPRNAVYAPIQLDCECAARAPGEARSLLVVGWEAAPSSYATVAEGLLGGFARSRAPPAVAVDFLHAPAYRKAWETLHSEGVMAGLSRGGLQSRTAVYRLDAGEQDFIVPPALYNVAPHFTEHVARGGGPLPGVAAAHARARAGAPPRERARCPDVLLRVHYPLDVSPSACARTRVFVFGTVEEHAGTSVQSFQQTRAEVGADFWAALPPSVTLLTPSNWSAARFVAGGAPRAALRVLPHGFDPRVFFPPRGGPGARAAARAAAGLSADACVVGVTVGHMRERKGIDVLLRAAVRAARRLRGAECLRLVLKGVDALYGATAKVEELADAAGLRGALRELRAARRLRLDLRGETVPHGAVAELLRGADFFVSPYRAEGFNLPVLEAAACGLPVIVTRGGPTDDFTDASFARFVAATPTPGGIKGARLEGSLHLEPDEADLADALVDAVRDAPWRARAGAAAHAWVRAHNFTWEAVAERHKALFFGADAAEEREVPPGGE
jgi:glycosyltransferase involved in cell wall biosynthesis